MYFLGDINYINIPIKKYIRYDVGLYQMTLQEGLAMIQPSPYGEPDDKHLLARVDSVTIDDACIRVFFRVALYKNDGNIYGDRIGIPEKVSRDALLNWFNSKLQSGYINPPADEELNHDGYEYHTVNSLYNQFLQLTQQEKDRKDAAEASAQ